MEPILRPITELFLNYFPFGGFHMFLSVAAALLEGLFGLLGLDIGFMPV